METSVGDSGERVAPSVQSQKVELKIMTHQPIVVKFNHLK